MKDGLKPRILSGFVLELRYESVVTVLEDCVADDGAIYLHFLFTANLVLVHVALLLLLPFPSTENSS